MRVASREQVSVIPKMSSVSFKGVMEKCKAESAQKAGPTQNSQNNVILLYFLHLKQASQRKSQLFCYDKAHEDTEWLRNTSRSASDSQMPSSTTERKKTHTSATW